MMFGLTSLVPSRCLLAILLVFFCFLTSGCQAANPGPEAGGRSLSTIVLTRDDSGKTVVMRPGDRLAIRLAEKPAAGYRWAVETYNEQVVVQAGTDYTRSDGAAVGGGGHRQLTFEAKAPGKVILHLKLWQPWAGDASIVERFVVTLQIQS